jgi:hypothetical protein
VILYTIGWGASLGFACISLKYIIRDNTIASVGGKIAVIENLC